MTPSNRQERVTKPLTHRREPWIRIEQNYKPPFYDVQGATIGRTVVEAVKFTVGTFRVKIGQGGSRPYSTR